jgi:hypothetical protein
VDTACTPILLTSSVIAHDKGVRLQDPKERERLAMESVQRWRDIAPTHPLVLCDGSGFDFTSLVEALPNNSNIECLYFQNDAKAIQLHGRGFGEGEIVRFALEHSTFIQTAGRFAKCTSKLWVENFSECISRWNGSMLLKGVFDDAFSPIRPTRLSYVDTRFYIMSVENYRAHFLHAHTAIRASQGQSLEECFKDVFLSLSCPPSLMKVPPVICGTGGGTGKYYKNTAARRLKERLRYLLIRRQLTFKSWFA